MMGIIYEPHGKAKEYCNLAANIFSGCDHECKYCYAPACTYKSRENFKKSKVRDSVLLQLTKEAAKYKGQECLLCFTCDPYQQIEAETMVTRNAINILLANEVKVTVLTKGGKRSIRDFDILEEAAKKDLAKYGTTLTFINDEDSKYYEPGAALPLERIECLKEAKSRGIPTWVSFEPVIDPEQSLELIKLTHKFVDLYKIGKWNHSKEAEKIDWVKYGSSVINLLDKLGNEYYIKKDLAAILDKNGGYTAS